MPTSKAINEAMPKAVSYIAVILPALAFCASLVISPVGVHAGQTLAVFPIDMTFPKTEEEFFGPKSGPSPEEQARLARARDELARLLGADGKFEVVDIAPIEKDIAAAQPIYSCNGCEIDIAGKAKADLVLTSVIDKISDTHLSLSAAIVDVGKSRLVRSGTVLIQGNTDEAWMHGVRWLAKNRLLSEVRSQ